LATRSYELMLILSPELDEAATEALLERIRGYLAQAKATVTSFNTWGLRRLAYPIKRQKEGRYYLVNFTAEPRLVKEFERNLLLAEGVLRELVIRLDEVAGEAAPAATPEVPVVAEPPAVEPPATETTEQD